MCRSPGDDRARRASTVCLITTGRVSRGSGRLTEVVAGRPRARRTGCSRDHRWGRCPHTPGALKASCIRNAEAMILHGALAVSVSLCVGVPNEVRADDVASAVGADVEPTRPSTGARAGPPPSTPGGNPDHEEESPHCSPPWCSRSLSSPATTMTTPPRLRPRRRQPREAADGVSRRPAPTGHQPAPERPGPAPRSFRFGAPRRRPGGASSQRGQRPAGAHAPRSRVRRNRDGAASDLATTRTGLECRHA